MSKEKNPQIFVAKLSSDVREKDLEYEFRKYGSIKNIQMKRGYAFIEYDDYKDAEEAIKEMNGKRFEGQKIVVQQAMGKRRDRERSRERSGSRGRANRDGRMRRGPQTEDICYNCGKSGHWANECRLPVKPKGQYFKDDVKCYKCQERGHLGKDCKNSRNSKSVSRSRSRDRYEGRRRRSPSENDSRSVSRDRRHRRRSQHSRSMSGSHHSRENRKREGSPNGKSHNLDNGQGNSINSNNK